MNKTVVSIPIDRDLKDKIQKQADKNARTFCGEVRYILEKAMKVKK